MAPDRKTPDRKRSSEALRLVTTLGLVALASGLILVGTHLLTQPLILHNQVQALEAAVFRVLPGAQNRKIFVVREGNLSPRESIPTESTRGETTVFGGYDGDGRLIGYAIPAEGAGFQDTIRLIYGLDPAKRAILGMEVLESRETPGLGDKIIKDDDFLENFHELSVDPVIVAVPHGTKSAPNEVDSISGATISSKAVVQIINESQQEILPIIREESGDK